MADVNVRSVLGDERLAPINPGGGYPWYSCPFCTYAVYVGEASPEHSPEATPATHGRCQNPWCLANPAMPLDAARRIAQAALDAADAAARRQRDQDAARRRIAEYAASQAQGRAAIVAEALRQGACQPCALKAWRHGREKYVHHRGQCPKARQNGPQSRDVGYQNRPQKWANGRRRSTIVGGIRSGTTLALGEGMKKNEANRIAETTVDAYSRNRYTDSGWKRIAQALLDAGATAAEAEYILNSKHMRWAADDANRNHSATSADFLAYANKRKGKEGTGLAGLVLAARKELATVDAKTGFPQTGADLAGACEEIAELINLALKVRARSRDEALVAEAGRILDEITGRAKGGR